MAFGDLKALRHMTWHLAFAVVVMSVSTFAYGFDNQVYSTIQAMDAFEKRFGTYDPETKTYAFSALHLAFLNSLGLITKAAGVILGGLTADYLGRKTSFMLMQLLCIVGIAVSYTAKEYGQILGGRMLVQAFVGWDTLLVPLYLAEIAPAAIRGGLVGVFVFAHQFGSFICSFVTFRSSKYTTDESWQLPIIVGLAFPLFSLLAGWYFAESPRWLVIKKKHQRAIKAVEWYVGGAEGFDPAVEVALLDASIEEDMATKGHWMDLFRGTNRIRTFIACMAGVFNQLTGQSFVSQYGTIFVKSIGTIDPFTFNVVSRLGSSIGPALVFFSIDSIGRRPLYFVMAILCIISLMTLGGLGVGDVTHAKKSGIVAMTALFGCFYSAGFGAVGAIISAETPHDRLRDKSNVLVYVLHTICDFSVTFSLPYLLNAPYANLKSKVGFIYGSVAVVGLVWAYFFVPEASKRSLEQLDEMWRAEVPPRKFKSWKSPIDSIGARITRNEDTPEDMKGAELAEHIE